MSSSRRATGAASRRRRSSSRSTYAATSRTEWRCSTFSARRVHGSGGAVLDSVREFCRKRGIKLEPGRGATPAASSDGGFRREAPLVFRAFGTRVCALEGTRTRKRGHGVARRAQVVLGLAVLVAVALAVVAEPGRARRQACGLRQGRRRDGEARGQVARQAQRGRRRHRREQGRQGGDPRLQGEGRRRRDSVRCRRSRGRAGSHGSNRPARGAHRPLATSGADRRLVRARRLRDRDARCRVTDGTNVYALSNNHVFAGVNTASIGDPITQPGPDDGGSDPRDRIATLADYQAIDFNGGDNTMDAAIALTSAGDVGTATPPDGYGAPSTTPTAASIGMGVQKYGRTTGSSWDRAGHQPLVDVCYSRFGEFCFPGYEARFVNQISVSPGTFSAPGDSGSLMVTQGGNQPVALLFAGDGSLTIGNPIIPVLQRFNVTIEGGLRRSGPTAPTNLARTAGDAGQPSPGTHRASTEAPRNGLLGVSRPEPGRRDLLRHPRSPRRATSTRPPSTARPTTTRCPPSNAYGEARIRTRRGDPDRAVAPTAPLTILDGFNRPNENPLSDQGRWTNSDHRRRERPQRHVQPARLLGDDDMHGLAKQRSVRPRCRGLRAATDAARGHQPAAPVRASPASGQTVPDVGESAERHRRGLARPLHRRRRSASRRFRRSSRPGTSCSYASTARASRPGGTTGRPGPVSASCRTRPMAPPAMPWASACGVRPGAWMTSSAVWAVQPSPAPPPPSRQSPATLR